MEIDDLEKLLNENIVYFSYWKADGTVRNAKGTRLVLTHQDQYFCDVVDFTIDDMPSNVRKKSKWAVRYWDIDKCGWRSVSESSIISVDKIMTKDEIFGKELDLF